MFKNTCVGTQFRSREILFKITSDILYTVSTSPGWSSVAKNNHKDNMYTLFELGKI